MHDKRRARHIEKTNNLQIFPPPRWGASGVAATAAMCRLSSRSPASRDAGPRETMGAMVRSQSPPRGPDRPSCRRGEVAADGAT
jgi:hypothetical protein